MSLEKYKETGDPASLKTGNQRPNIPRPPPTKQVEKERPGSQGSTEAEGAQNTSKIVNNKFNTSVMSQTQYMPMTEKVRATIQNQQSKQKKMEVTLAKQAKLDRMFTEKEQQNRSTSQYPEVNQSNQKYLKVAKGTSKYPKVSQSNQRYPKVPRTTSNYPELPQSTPGVNKKHL